MDDEKIAQVAKAICEQLFGPYDEVEAKEAWSSPSGQAKVAAVAAITAMREPTEKMLRAGEKCDTIELEKDTWQAMIDAIIGENQ